MRQGYLEVGQSGGVVHERVAVFVDGLQVERPVLAHHDHRGDEVALDGLLQHVHHRLHSRLLLLLLFKAVLLLVFFGQLDFDCVFACRVPRPALLRASSDLRR